MTSQWTMSVSDSFGLTKDEFEQLIITLEIRGLTLGLELHADNLADLGAFTQAQADQMEAYEHIQSKLYAGAAEFGLDDQFNLDAEIGLWRIAPESALEGKVRDAIERHERSVAYDMIARHLATQHVQSDEARNTNDPEVARRFVRRLDHYTHHVYANLDRHGLAAYVADQRESAMRENFERLSQAAIASGECEFSPEQKAAEWIGKLPASAIQITATETRLGIALPEDYKALMALTNGFDAPSTTDPSFLPIEDIDYLHRADPYLIEAYDIDGNQEIVSPLKRAIFVGGKDEEQHFFLVPPENDAQNWSYWKFANWIPGEAAYGDLSTYFDEVIEILSSEEGA